MKSVKKNTSIKIPAVTESNLEEVGAHLKQLSDGEIERPKAAALNMFIDAHVSEYSEQFDSKGDDQILYVGDRDE